MALQIRRGTNSQRLGITPAEGELIYTTDTDKLFIGDGSTAGGLEVSGGTDSATVQAIINASSIDAAQLDGQNPSYYLDYGNLSNVPATQTDSSTVDSIVLNLVDSAYVQARETAQDFAYSSLTGAPTIPTNNSQLTNGAAYVTQAAVDSAITALIDGAPGALDTLNELAAALGDDAAFESTVTNSLATKLNLSGGTLTGTLVSQNIEPTTDDTYDLGSTTKRFRDLYLGPGSLYVNNKKVIEDESGTITFKTDSDQNLNIKTQGTGQTTIQSAAGINLTSTGSADVSITTNTGNIEMNGDVIINSTNSINSSNSDPINFGDNLDLNSNKIVNVGTPTAVTDAVNKTYVDNLNVSTFTNDAGYVTDAVDSANVTAMIDATYVQARQDKAYSSLTGAPTNVSDFTNDAGYLTAATAGGLDSALVSGIITDDVDKAFVDALNPDADTLDGQNGTYYLDYNNFSNTPTLPTDTTDLTNGAGYISASSTDTLTNKSGNVSMFTNDAGYLTSVDAALDSAEVTAMVDSAYIQARQDFAYGSLTGAPTIPTNNNQLTNGAGYLTSFTETNDLSSAVTWANIPDANVPQSAVTQHQAALSITESQISDLAHTTSLAFSAITSTPTTLAGYGITDGGGTDSAAVVSMIDSAYVQNRQSTVSSGATTIDTSTFTATAGQTVFTVNYTVDKLNVYLNGILLDPSDYTATNGTSITLDTGAAVNDLVNVITYTTLAVGNLDSAGVTELVDSTYVQARQGGNVSQFTNDAGYLTSAIDSAYVTTQIDGLIDAAPGALNTLNELAAAIGDDANFSTTITNQIAALPDSSQVSGIVTADVDKAFVDALGINATQLNSQAASYYLDYNNFSNTPTIPTNNNQLTNGAGYITSVPAQSFASLTGKPTTIAGYGITDAFDSAEAISAITASDLDMGGNKVLFGNVYSAEGDLPSASDYHGMFAHVHGTGAGYFAHGGNWIRLANNSDVPTDVSDLTDTTSLLGLDSAATISLVDSSYVAARTGSNSLTVNYTPAPKYARLTMSSDQTGITTAAALTTFNTRDTDTSTGNALTSTLADGKFIIPAGVTKVQLRASLMTSSVSDQITMEIRKNGNRLPSGTTNFDISSTGRDHGAAYTGIIDVVENDYFQIFLFSQNSRTAEQDEFSWFEIEVVEGSMLNTAVASTIELSNLSNVDSATPTDGQALVWDNSNNYWKPGTIASGGGTVDSADIIAIVDSDYIQARQTSSGSVSSLSRSVFTFTATANQTVFTGTAGSGGTLAFNDEVDIYINGILIDPSDYTLSDGDTLTLASGTGVGNIVTVIDYGATALTLPSLETYTYTATSNQTTFSGSDGSNTLAYSAGKLNVYLNGILLISGTDYTATNGTSVVLASGADTGNILQVVAWSETAQGTLDSDGVTNLIDSAYVTARAGAGTDSATVSAIITADVDATFINNLTIDADTLGGQNSAYHLNYNNFTNTPTIPTNNNQLTNGAGYLTSFTETNDLSSAVTWANIPDANVPQSAVTQHQAALTITESQISDLAHTTSLAFSAITSTPTTLAGYGITDAFDGAYGSLSGAPTIPSLGNDFVDSAYVTTQVNTVIDAAPGALNTLNELAAALGDDANFSTTITNQIAGKLDSAQAIATITSSDLDMGGNKVLFGNVYSAESDLPSASSYHGMFAHVHATGAGYFAHGGNWIRLANNSDLYADADVTALIDSSYVQLRETAQDFAFSSITGTPTTLAGYGITDGGSGGTDSATVSSIITADVDAAFVTNLGFTAGSSAAASDGIDTTYVYTATAGQTAFTGSDDNSATLSYATNSVMVYLNGILLVPSTDYTATDGSTVTLASGATLNDEVMIVTVKSGPKTWTEESGTHTAVAGEKLFVDVSSAIATVTLPASPTMGDEVRVIDATGNCATNNITINRNGNNINGTADNLVLNINRAAIGLAYYNSTQGWVLIER